jgi:hypothetical protein
MTDFVGYTPGDGENVAVDRIDGVIHQRVKMQHGADGTAVDVSEANPMPINAVGELIEAVEAMRYAIHSLTRSMGQAMPDTAGRLRVNVELGALTASIAAAQTLATVTTVATLTNQTQIGGLPAFEQIPALMRLGADSLRRNVSVS